MEENWNGPVRWSGALATHPNAQRSFWTSSGLVLGARGREISPVSQLRPDSPAPCTLEARGTCGELHPKTIVDTEFYFTDTKNTDF